MVVTAPVRFVRGWEFPLAGTYAIDASQSLVGFEVHHHVLATARGVFQDFTGSIEIADAVEESSVEVMIEAASMSTGNRRLDAYLRESRMVGDDAYPFIAFSSTAVERVVGGQLQVRGDLSIRGISHPVMLDVEFIDGGLDHWDDERITFKASTRLNREDWGIAWKLPLNMSRLIIGKDVRIVLDIQATRTPALVEWGA